MDNSTNISDPVCGRLTPAASAFTFVASPVGLGPLVPESSSAYLRVPPEAARNADAQYLLEGFSRLLGFLLNEEVGYLCGVPHKARSPQRINFRGGFRARKLRTSIGTIFIRVPILRYLHPRVSIVKRAKRLSPAILETLARLRARGVTPDETAVLIKTLWTLDLPDSQLATLVEKLTPLLEQWRGAAP